MNEIIFNIIEKLMLPYLEEVLLRNSPEKHEQIKIMFTTHMKHITEYCMENYINRAELTIPFIKWLHKMLFPKGYTQTTKMANGVVVVSMIPGQYKTLENTGVSYLYPWKEVYLVPPAKVKESMEHLIANYNITIKKSTTTKEVQDIALQFWLDFWEIHPFGDANGRIMNIVTNLMLVKKNITPIRFDILKRENLPDFFRALELARIEHNLSPFYEIIEKYSR